MGTENYTLKKLEQTELSVGNARYLLVNLVSEKCVRPLGERHAVFLGQRLSDLAPSAIKLRVQCNPAMIHRPEDRPSVVQWAKEEFEKETRVLQECGKACGVPELFGYETLRQDITFEYPNGHLNVLAMSRAPGLPLTDVHDLTDVEILSIKQQLVEILEKLRCRGWRYIEGDPERIIYDRNTKKISLTGLSRASARDPTQTTPFTEKSYVIWEFGLDIWR